jgi:hypothetical protein
LISSPELDAPWPNTSKGIIVRTPKRFLSCFSCLLVLIILSAAAPEASAQRRRARRETKARSGITAAKIRNDVVGKQLFDVPLENGIDRGRWSFAKDEWKEVDVLETRLKAGTAAVAVFMRTGGLDGELKGKLRLYYERVAGEWVLQSIENLTAKIAPYANNQVGQRQGEVAPLLTPAQAPPVAVPIARGAYTIPAGSHQYFNFHVDHGIGRLVGNFQATGGRNDIEVYVLDALQYVNFANGHRAPTFYNSGRVTVGRLDVPLGPGKYVLVFSNNYSVITPKAVSAEIVLSR